MDLTEKTQNEKRHPWELSRARCILGIIKKYHLDCAADIGAGDMFFISKLQPWLSGTAYAVDAAYGKEQEDVDGIRCFNDFTGLPNLSGHCGLVLMDVLEHIENAAAFLSATLEKIPAGGLVFITVPAFQFLFSEHDTFLKHYRRYGKKDLLALLRSQNLSVEKCHYFYTSLFFARLPMLLWKKKKKQAGVGAWRFGEKHIATCIVYFVLNIDFFICNLLAKLHITLPGLSLLAVCKKW